MDLEEEKIIKRCINIIMRFDFDLLKFFIFVLVVLECVIKLGVKLGKWDYLFR